MTNQKNSNIIVNNLTYNRYYDTCCEGSRSYLSKKYSKEEAEKVLSGDIHLKEVVVLHSYYDRITGRSEEKAEKTILAWLGEKGKFVVADVSHSKEQLKNHLHRGWYFSGHRYGNGPQASLMVEEALDAFCPGWYKTIDDVAGPSSWRIDISVKDDGTIIANSHIGGDIVLGKI